MAGAEDNKAFSETLKSKEGISGTGRSGAPMKIGVFLGGLSGEKEVSLNSGRNVYDNLDRERYDPRPLFVDRRGGVWLIPWQLISQNTTVDIEEQLCGKARRIPYEEIPALIDFAFLALHGKYGEDGCIQGMLELQDIPYTGSGVLGSALSMDKHLQQMFLQAEGVGTPEGMAIDEGDWQRRPEEIIRNLQARFSFPFFVKPAREGSSIGVAAVRTKEELRVGIEAALKWDKKILVEEGLSGREFSCIVLEEEGGAKALNLTEIVPQSEFYTYDDKYMPGRCRKFTPPKNIPREAVEMIKKEAVKAFRALAFRSYGRIDGFYLPDGRILITDPNASSGMAPSSFFFEQAASQGLSPGMILTALIENALKIHRGKKGPL